MTKKPWNVFTTENPTAQAFTTLVSRKLPERAPLLDRTGKKLPTPYGLLLEWLGRNLTGDWCSMTARGAVVVKVKSDGDATRITERFRPIGSPRASDVSPMTTQINYRDEGYAVLATEMGYQLR